MYHEHFGLHSAPFSLTPDTAFAYSSRAHQEALNTLLLAVDDGQGFIKITGEVGTGKTLACRRLLAALAERGGRYETAYVPNPCVSPRTLLLAIAQELKIDAWLTAPELKLLTLLNQRLLSAAAAGRRVVVCLDEVQSMPDETLESLRLLSNLETEKSKLLQVVLFGQPELDKKLARTSLRQLASRITFQYALDSMTIEETERYLAHRLRVAGRTDGGAGVFAPAVARQLHQACRGVPRLLNIVAHKALLLAFGEGALQVTSVHVRAAAADTPYVEQLRARTAWAPWSKMLAASVRCLRLGAHP